MEAARFSERWCPTATLHNPEDLVKRKSKFVPVLFSLTDHHTIKAYWGVEV
jgi:hypothetical protein